MLAERGISPLLVLRLISLFVVFFIAMAVLFGGLYILSVMLTRRTARRMGTAVIPIAVRLLPYMGALSSEIERRAALLRAAGYLEVGRFVTDRPPRAVIVGFAASDGSHFASAVEHALLGTYIELVRTDSEGGSVSLVDVRLPRATRPPWMRVLSRPGADVAKLRTELEAHSSSGASVVHDAAAYVKRFETSYRRAMEWAYTEGPMRNVDPEAVAKTTGVAADAETTYYLKMRREAASASKR